MLIPGYELQLRCGPTLFTGITTTAVTDPTRAQIVTLLKKGAIEEIDVAEQGSNTLSGKLSRFERPQLILKGAPFPHFTYNQCSSGCGDGGLAHVHRLEVRLFSGSNYKRTQTVPSLCLQGGQAYKYAVMPFGLSLVPRLFTRYMTAVLSHVWSSCGRGRAEWEIFCIFHSNCLLFTQPPPDDTYLRSHPQRSDELAVSDSRGAAVPLLICKLSKVHLEGNVVFFPEQQDLLMLCL